MDSDFSFSDDDFDRLQKVHATAGLANVGDVSPDAGAVALQHGPPAGIPPSVAMRSPDVTQGIAQSANDASVITASPPVAKWAATGEPAAVATGKDDLGSLAKIGHMAGLFSPHSFDDIVQGTVATLGHVLQRSPAGQIAGIGQGLQQAQDVGATAGGALAAKYAATSTPNVPLLTQFNDALSKTVGPVFNSPVGKALGLGYDLTTPVGKQSFFKDQLSQLLSLPLMEGVTRGIGLVGEGNAPAPGESVAPTEPTPPIDLAPGPGGVWSVPEVPRLGVHPTFDAAREVVANADAQAASSLQEAIAQSKMHSRSPEAMEQFLAQQPSERPVDLDPDKLIELASQGHEPFPENAQAILQASRDGEDYEVPLSRYLARTAGQPFAEELNASTTFREGGTSVAEAAERPAPTSTTPVPFEAEAGDFTPEEQQRAQYLAEGSRAQVQQIVKEQYLKPLFNEASAIGMTKTQLERYSSGIESAVSDAQERMTQRAYEQIRRERKPDWQNSLAQHSAAVEQELAARPDIRARAYLAQGKGPLGEPLEKPSLKFDREDQLSKHAQDVGLQDRMFKRGGSAPDEVAEELGYPSGADLIRDLDTLNRSQGDLSIPEHMKAMIREEATRRTREELGYDFTPNAIHEAASAAVAGPKVENFLSQELQELATQAKLPFDKEAVRGYAQQRFDSLLVREATNLKKLEGYVYKGGVKAEQALLKGDFATAFLRKQQQFIHHLMLQQAHSFLREFRSATKQWKSLASDKSRPSLEQRTLDTIHSELQKYGYRVPQANLKYDYEKWATAQRDLGNTVQPQQPVPPITPLDMTVQEFQDLADRITNMVHLGRDAKKILIAGAKQDMDELISEAVAGASEVSRKPRINTAVRKEGKLSIPRWEAELYKPEFMIDKLDDNNPNGVFNRVLMHGANDAHNTELELKRTVLDGIQALRDAVPKDVRGSWTTRIASGHGLLDPSTGREMSLTKYDLLSTALNIGNEINRWHLEEGGWGWNRDAYTRLIEQSLSPREMDFVQGIWDLLDKELWPKLAETERSMSGLVPEKIQSTPVTFSDGREYRGGYWPLVRDAERTNEAPSNGDLDRMFTNFLNDAATPKGFTKKRTLSEYPVLLDFQNVLFNHISQVTKRIAYADYITSSGRFLRQPEIAGLVKDVHGQYGMDQFKNWLHRQVGYRLTDPRALQSASNFFRQWRENTYMVGAGLRLSVGLEHASTFGQLAAVAGEKAAFGGYTRWAMNPLGATRFALDSSQFLSNRINEVNRELRDIAEDINSDISNLPPALEVPIEILRKAGHFFISWINQYTVAVPGWTGAYWDAREGAFAGVGKPKLAPMDHAEAVRYADKVVSKAHGSGAEKDLSAFQSGGNEFFRALNMYYNYHGSQYQLNRGAINRTVRGRDVSERAEGFRQGFWAIIFSAVVGAYVAGRGAKSLAGKDLAPWFMDNVLGSLANGVPIAREGYQAVSNRIHGRPWDFEMSPLAQGAVTVGKASEDALKIAHLTHGRPSRRALQNLIEAPGYFLGLPTGQIAATVQGLADFNKPGNKHPIAGVVFGPSHEKDKK